MGSCFLRGQSYGEECCLLDSELKYSNLKVSEDLETREIIGVFLTPEILTKEILPPKSVYKYIKVIPVIKKRNAAVSGMSTSLL